MPVTLSKELRSQLARTTLEARQVAEDAAHSALEHLAVDEAKPRSHMDTEQRKLRNRLRARGRALGDYLKEDDTQGIQHLVELVAYEAWHRLLFTRFLTENHLLHTDPEHGTVPVSLQECEELAPELGARDGFELACRFAQQILPGVFRSDDPALELRLSLDDEVALRKLVNSIPTEVFKTDDALGWTYQFWQEQRKDAINASGVKIGADELSPVTQLFTEDYMVEFLLHNTLGAWWAGKLGKLNAINEEDARAKVALPEKEGLGITWTYLRLCKDEKKNCWNPAAGTFECWPKTALGITLLDPCMGSGHFLVFALPLLVRLRMEEESVSAREAVYATLRDNIHGLELDERCSQIAAFNLALTAWKLGGFQPLPELHLACSGLSPHTTEKKWGSLSGNNARLRHGMERLYKLFHDAPILGSLIDPRSVGGDLLEAGFHELQPLLEKALTKESDDDLSHEMAVTARGLVKASEILSGQFTLVATNVPYLGRPDQKEALKGYCDQFHRTARSDLATCFIERCLSFCNRGASTALVTPQSWLFQSGYKKFRHTLLENERWEFLACLGPRAFETISGERVNVCLLALTHSKADTTHSFVGIDVTEIPNAIGKTARLLDGLLSTVVQNDQLKNPDTRITLQSLEKTQLLANHAVCIQGLATSDDPQFTCYFWEFSQISNGWEGLMGTVEKSCTGGGRERLIHWEDGVGRYFRHAQSLKAEGRLGGWKSGTEARGKMGVLVSQMSMMPVTVYSGEFYDHNASVIVAEDESVLPAIWALTTSPEFVKEVRKLDSSLKPSNSVFIKVPFDLEKWQKIAAEKYPHGFPKPYSCDPKQWLFNGYPKGSDQPLHVAVCRLLGYLWPRQTGSSFPDCPSLKPDGLEKYADDDGIVCLPAIHREQPAAHRLRQLLSHALGSYDEKALIKQTSSKGLKSTTLDDWLRDEFFEQHCSLFQHRPFIWHLWDGRKDGFHALVNYHKLDHATLKKLTFTYLGEWITQQEKDSKTDKPGAAERLGAAQTLQKELEAILEGEAPYDIFVRWKRLDQQAIGWHPDLNDGVRMNIRPFMMAQDVSKRGAGILRTKPNINWNKDRGTEPEANRPKSQFPWFYLEDEPEEVDPKPEADFVGNRWNTVFLSLEKKRKARKHV